MTTEKEAAPEKTQAEAPKSSEPSEKGKSADSTAVMTAEYARDEQDRRTVILGSILLILLGAPVFLPTEGERSLWRMTRHDSTGRVIIVLMFGIPVLLGIVGALRGFRRSVPKGVFLVFSSVMTCLFTLAGVAMMSMLLIYERRAVESPLIWLGALASLSATLTFVRSFFRQRWQKYQHLVAAFGFLTLMMILAIGGAEPRAMARIEDGGWVFLFATAALFPLAMSTLLSRRPE